MNHFFKWHERCYYNEFQKGEVMLAIPIFGNEVAPRFASVSRFILATVNMEGTPILHGLRLPKNGWSCHLQHLATLGVTVLLCGGFNRRYLPFARSLRIQVISGLSGRVDHLVSSFFQDALEPFRLGRGETGQSEKPTKGELVR